MYPSSHEWVTSVYSNKNPSLRGGLLKLVTVKDPLSAVGSGQGTERKIFVHMPFYMDIVKSTNTMAFSFVPSNEC